MERLSLAFIILPILSASLANDILCPDNDTLNFNASKIIYTVYNKANIYGTEIGFDQGYYITNKTTFNLSLKTVFLIHGWLNPNGQMPIILKQALFEVGDYNIIVVNWNAYAQQLYGPAAEAVPYVGTTTAELINDIIQTHNYFTDNITMIGHSLGAHISGFTGKATNGLIGTIIGLDPAKPCYYENNPGTRLNANDAKYVEVMHTNTAILGASYVIGHVDFWPNGGAFQPGCLFDVSGMCSHLRSFAYMGESITNNKFYAKSCESYSSYSQKKCNNNIPTLMGGKPEDYYTQVIGNYYMNTNSNSPYGSGNVNP